jgi:hypothetical protein
MSGKRAFVAIAVASVLGLLSTSAAWSSFDHSRDKGGFVKPCSLDGVNPLIHPDISGNPAVARSYGFVQSRYGGWRVEPNCRPF